jgi:hypothetical protein
MDRSYREMNPFHVSGGRRKNNHILYSVDQRNSQKRPFEGEVRHHFVGIICQIEREVNLSVSTNKVELHRFIDHRISNLNFGDVADKEAWVMESQVLA